MEGLTTPTIRTVESPPEVGGDPAGLGWFDATPPVELSSYWSDLYLFYLICREAPVPASLSPWELDAN